MLWRSIKDFFGKYKDGIDYISYPIYGELCKLLYTKESELLNNDDIANFNKENILVLPSYIDPIVAEEMGESLLSNLNQNKKITNKHLSYSKIPSRFYRFFIDRYLRNAVIYYSFPDNYLSEASLVLHPIKNIKNFRNQIHMKCLPIINSLMGSKSNIFKAWAYKTKNINKKETSNTQNRLHTDGDIYNAIKCIIYLSDVDLNNGPFCYLNQSNEIVPILGPKGTTIFFKCSILRHKGANTLLNERLALSFTAYPSLKNKIALKELRPDFLRSTLPFMPTSKRFLIDA